MQMMSVKERNIIVSIFFDMGGQLMLTVEKKNSLCGLMQSILAEFVNSEHIAQVC